MKAVSVFLMKAFHSLISEFHSWAQKLAELMLGRVFCKKGCDADSDSWEDCVGDCSEICYKDPVLKDRPWTAVIDRSPGDAKYSEECFHACVAGCGYKFDVEAEIVNKVKPKRPPPPPPKPQPPPPPPRSQKPMQPPTEDVLATSA
ncbi:hypothetical protein ISN44_As04g022280 [Arabidopsis suecica]|uniref:Defensin-like protein n=1 Tax=Arabidopsis suecica TaxID=45249 RepID=A0A8T2EB94_ARASU|nr:hypothetical protein ISN44_As04g022280 [Arabidopsis suecica]